jgi:hypothetical protein
MIVHGREKNANNSTAMMRLLLGLCFVVVSYVCIGARFGSPDLNSIIGINKEVLNDDFSITHHSVVTVLECAFACVLA